MALSKEQRDLVVGTLLGDANLQTESQGRTWRYRALQSAEQEAYLDHKFQIMRNLCNMDKPVYDETRDERTNKVYKRYYFNTRTHASLRFFGNMFYTYDKKTNRMVKDVPVRIEKYLTPAAVAYWYMDDGSLQWPGNSNAMRICTESFSNDGVFRLQKALKNLYNIQPTLIEKNKIVEGKKVLVGFRMAINEGQSAAFRELIKPHLVDSMKYKVSDGNKGHL